SDLRTFSGDFTQQLTSATGRAGKTLAGQFVLAKGGKFRWQVEKPYEQLLLADGKQLLIYDADLKQLSKRSMDSALSATPLALLLGQSEVENQFHLSPLPDRDGLAWLAAEPKTADAAVSQLQFGFAQGVLMAMSWSDNFGQKSLLKLSNTSKNSTLAEGVFRFTPPPGTDIVQ
ncbi:MAG: outer rane lipoprotein carrier protein, partial [Pseudomonadota bacterium]